MRYKDSLLVLTTYPEPTPVAAIDDAVAIAEALGSKLSAVACSVKLRTPGSLFADMLIDIPAMTAAEFEKSATAAEQLLAAFRSTAEKHDVFQQVIAESGGAAEVPEIIVDHARLHDLSIVPVPSGELIDPWYAEAVIFGAGRPVMVMPQTRRTGRPFSLGTAVVAWDFSRPAARAVADALPILKRMQRVHVLTVTSEKEIKTRQSAAALAAHLARHGVEVVLDSVDAGGRRIGTLMEAHVQACGADLLVMGAYGHSRVRQFILGGATRSMLQRPPVPVLLSH
ncbi:MAG TPA: universal stress protein [Pseudolabrys sp.]|nr:universal stress protein [Pseudolabrys sp.]